MGGQFTGKDKGGVAHGLSHMLVQGTTEAALAYLNGARGRDVGRAFAAGGMAGFASTMMGDTIRGWVGGDGTSQTNAQQFLTGQMGRAIGGAFGNEGAGYSGAMREVTYNSMNHPGTAKSQPGFVARILRSLGLDNFNLDASVAYYNGSNGAGYGSEDGRVLELEAQTKALNRAYGAFAELDTSGLSARMKRSVDDRIADVKCSLGKLPDTLGLTDAQKGELYSRLMLDLNQKGSGLTFQHPW